jgi:putative membrane protein
LPQEGKQELAKERTDLAEDRTLLANERTYAGWLRTGFASIAVGLGFQALFEMLKPAWVPKGIATAFLLIGIFVFISAERRAAAMNKRFHPHEVETFKLVNLRLITIAAVSATVALTAAIWMLGP